ncbi:hypothetical protein QWY31_11885 [Cytophagales bacterium LB-30]|uniref:Curli production assembly/transport component CsgG n=1 Tax=Shiella aurantiaca TaxID=3058365 RepID=A0ABT8F8D7_9BACT|nr:hypothetical protein [Shiella aurantiaca]MDN4166206.1 hypothetical protein [Shiella aurantiaca]
MKTRLFITTVLFFWFAISASAQSVGEFKPKEYKLNGANKFKSKDVYIANFSVNFQLYNLKTATTKGDFTGRMLTGDTKASLAVGLDVPIATLQEITDEAYQKFVQDLQAKGFNVLNGDAAAKTQFYEGYQRMERMEMSLLEAPGMLTVYPTDAVFYVKGFTKDGKKIQGGISATLNRAMNDDGRNSIVDEISKYPKLSDELDNATIVNADLYVLFLDVKKPYQGNGARIIANTNLRLASYEHIDSRVSKAGGSGSKEKQYLCVSAIDFVQGRNKIGGSPLGVYGGLLKEDLLIKEVIGQEEIQSYAKSDQDYIGVETGFGMMYRADNISVENTAVIKADAAKYGKGAKEAINLFLEHHVKQFEKKF